MLLTNPPLRNLSPIPPKMGGKPAAPTPPQSPDRAELNAGASKALTFAAVAGLCLMAGSALVQAQVAPPQAPSLLDQVQAQPLEEQSDMDQLQVAAKEQGISLQFRMMTEDDLAKPISNWHAEVILAEGGTVSVAESQEGAPDRIGYLTDAVQLRAYLKYMRGDVAETAQENGARVLKRFLNLSPTTQLLHPITLESLSPFSAADRLAREKPVTVSHEGMEKSLGNLRQANQWANPDPGCDPTQTYQENPGVWCLFGP